MYGIYIFTQTKYVLQVQVNYSSKPCKYFIFRNIMINVTNDLKC